MTTFDLLKKSIAGVPENIGRKVDLSFDIVDRIHEILERQGKTQKDLAIALGKKESEISKWMRGTHNFTIETIAKISVALGEDIITVARTPVSVKMPSTDFFITKNLSRPILPAWPATQTAYLSH
jgi:transcriptional regulator with XRE-family HTH domain